MWLCTRVVLVGNSHLSTVVKETTELEIHSEGPRRVVLNVMILQQKGFDQSMVFKTENIDMHFFTFDVLSFPLELDTKVLQESWSNKFLSSYLCECYLKDFGRLKGGYNFFFVIMLLTERHTCFRKIEWFAISKDLLFCLSSF